MLAILVSSFTAAATTTITTTTSGFIDNRRLCVCVCVRFYLHRPSLPVANQRGSPVDAHWLREWQGPVGLIT